MAENLLFIFFCKTLKIKVIAYFLIVKLLNIKILITFFKNGEKSFQNFLTFLILFLNYFITY